jgi:hypothetical protein
MTDLPEVKLKALPSFPVRFQVEAPVLLDTSNGVYTVSLDMDAVTEAAIAGVSFDAISPTTTRGDLIARGASSNQRLALGAVNTVLSSNGTDPAWVGLDTLLPTTTRGDLIFRNATTNARLAASTLGYHLQTNGAGTDPTWVGFVQFGTGAATRTWREKGGDFVSIIDFGATADASTAYSATFATANATALTRALATGKTVFIPYNVNGYSFAGSIAVSSGQCILGESQVLVKSQSATSFLNIVGFGFPVVKISNLHIDMTGSGASSTAIRMDTSGGVVYGVRLSNLYFTNCVEAIGDNGTPGGGGDYIVDLGIDDVRMAFTRGVQIHIRNSRGFSHLSQVQVDHTSNVGAVTWNGIQFDFFAGLEMSAVDVTGPVTGTYQSGVQGIYLAGTGTSAAVWMNRVNVDTTTGNGIKIEGMTYAWLNNLDVNYNSGNQVVLATCNKVEIVNSFAGGAVGKTNAAAGAAGFQFSACTNVHVSNTSTENNTGSGFYLNNSTDNLLSNVRSTGNGAWGVIEDGTSNRNLISGGVFATNSSGDVLLIGAASNIQNFLSSGALGGLTTTTPTPTAGTGSLTSASASLKYNKDGRKVSFTATVIITTNGTGATYIAIPLPVAAGAGAVCCSAFDETAVLGLVGYIPSSGTSVRIYTPAGAYPGANGKTLMVEGHYWTA